MTIQIALDYEIRSSSWASRISNPTLQDFVGKYFAWKVKRKFKRYDWSRKMEAIVRNKSVASP